MSGLEAGFLMIHIEHTRDLPKITIIGRPNVGKSSFFNRMLKHRKAITESASGVTRDRLSSCVKLNNVEFLLIDTGGIVAGSQEKIEALVCRQSTQAIDESDAVIFICDIRTGITHQDERIADILKRKNKKVFVAANKADDQFLYNDGYVFYGLGLDMPYAISVLNNRGLESLYKSISSFVSEFNTRRHDTGRHSNEGAYNCINIAVVGKPNVGKSSFINTIIGKERLLVDDSPGTTRDSIDISIKRGKNIVTIVDTAGIRHKKKFRDVIEVFSLSRTRESIKRSDIALIMIDAAVGLRREDMAVIDYVVEKGKACILIVNKCDLVNSLDQQEYKSQLINKYSPIEWMPVIFISCKEKKNLVKAMDLACLIYKNSHLSISTPDINKFLVKIQKSNPHVSHGRARPRILYATQVGIAPPKFLFFCSHASFIKKEYLRFMERQLRKEFKLEGIPINFQVREKKAKNDA
jgi:GTPase